MKIFTKESLKEELCNIRDRGWIENNSRKSNNDGRIGNMLEDLLGINENNLPLPNTGEWELKTQRENTTSLITLFHMEPSPTALKIVPSVLLPKYGWTHAHAGKKYSSEEKSFRQTITCDKYTDRGFTVNVNQQLKRVEIKFDHKKIDLLKHVKWKNTVKERIGLENNIHPIPYWGFDDLFHKAGSKLHKTFYVTVKVKREKQTEYFHYTEFLILQDFSLKSWLDAISSGLILVEFDARTGHNHGTKFRLRQNAYPSLFKSIERVV